jgi:predicted ATPase/class 3 adenylate cyclase
VSQTKKPEVRHRLEAILAADAVGYSRLMSEDERATLAALDAARKVFRTQIESQGGRVVDTAGDSVLASFETATGAVNAALAIQRKLSARLRFRIGVHLGDVLEKPDGSVYGDGVNVSAPLQALCEPGSVMISQAVHAAVASRVRSRFEDAGEHAVKNIADPVRAFRMRVEAGAVSPAVAVYPSGSPKPFAPPGAPPSLVGREADLAALDHLLAEHRHVTVLGAGGIGKTSLALAAAHARRSAQRDGVAWVDLSSISESRFFCAVVAQSLRLPVAGSDDPLPALVAGLKLLDVLLVLDNAEHLIEDVARLADAVAAGAPSVRLLVTSQVALKMEHEWVFRLGSLAIPEPGTSAEAAKVYGAVALFVDRAQAVDQRFRLTDANVDTVIELCRHLDGLALAIRLAAGRLPLLGLQGLKQRLGERLKLLVGTGRSAPTRQQTLRAALGWSYSLLSTEEQATFRHLGVFAGACGFNLELARAMADPAGQDEWTVIEHVSTLLDRSLVVDDGADPPRYRLLESAREYALQQLADTHELQAAHERFARAMISVLQRVNEAMWTTPDVPLLNAFGHELDNVRAAIVWSLQHAPQLALELVGESSYFYRLHLLHPELRRYAEALESDVSSASDAIAAKYWFARALAESQVAFRSTRAGERAAGLFRALGDERGVALSLCSLGVAQDYSDSKWSMVQAEMDSLAPEVWQLPRAKAWRFYADAGIYTTNERFDEALAVAEAGIAFARSNGFLGNAAFLTRYALFDELGLGRLEDAERRCCEQIENERRWRGGPLEVTLGCHAAVLARQGRRAEARMALLEFFEASRRSGWTLFGAFSHAFVEIALHEHRYRDAARLFGYARAAWGPGIVPRRESRKLLDTLESEIDATSLDCLLVEGKELTQEAVCALTLETASGHDGGHSPPSEQRTR